MAAAQPYAQPSCKEHCVFTGLLSSSALSGTWQQVSSIHSVSQFWKCISMSTSPSCEELFVLSGTWHLSRRPTPSRSPSWSSLYRRQSPAALKVRGQCAERMASEGRCGLRTLFRAVASWSVLSHTFALFACRRMTINAEIGEMPVSRATPTTWPSACWQDTCFSSVHSER